MTMASGLLRPIGRRQLSDRLLKPGLLGESLGWCHDLQNSSAGGRAGPGQTRSESSDARPAAGRGRGRGQALTGLSIQPGAPGPVGSREAGRAGPSPSPRAPGQGRPGAGRGRVLRQPEEQLGSAQPGLRPRPEGFRQGDRQLPGTGPRGRVAGQGGQQGRRPPRLLPGELQPGEQASGRYHDADEADSRQSQQRRRGRRASAPGRTPMPESAMVRAEPEGPGRGPGASASPARGARNSRQQYGDLAPDSLADAGRSFGGRSRRQDTTWQGFRTDQEEQRLKDILQSVKESLRNDTSAEIRPGPWSLDVHPEEGPIPEPFELEADYDRMMKLEALDPQLVMDFGGPPPARQPVPKMDPAELLEHFKPQIMQTLGFEGDEDTWQEVTEGQADMAIAMRDRDDQMKSRDIWGEIEEVKALVDELMPRDHPNRAHVDMSVEAMHSNSSYTLEKKIYQVKHLVHCLTTPLPERLRTRGLLGMHADM